MKIVYVCVLVMVIPLIGGCTERIIRDDPLIVYTIEPNPSGGSNVVISYKVYNETLFAVKQKLEKIERDVKKTLDVAGKKTPSSGDKSIRLKLEEIDIKLSDLGTALDVVDRKIPIPGDMRKQVEQALVAGFTDEQLEAFIDAEEALESQSPARIQLARKQLAKVLPPEKYAQTVALLNEKADIAVTGYQSKCNCDINKLLAELDKRYVDQLAEFDKRYAERQQQWELRFQGPWQWPLELELQPLWYHRQWCVPVPESTDVQKVESKPVSESPSKPEENEELDLGILDLEKARRLAQSYFGEGKEAYDKGYFKQSISCFDKALKYEKLLADDKHREIYKYKKMAQDNMKN